MIQIRKDKREEAMLKKRRRVDRPRPSSRRLGSCRPRRRGSEASSHGRAKHVGDLATRAQNRVLPGVFYPSARTVAEISPGPRAPQPRPSSDLSPPSSSPISQGWCRRCLGLHRHDCRRLHHRQGAPPVILTPPRVPRVARLTLFPRKPRLTSPRRISPSRHSASPRHHLRRIALPNLVSSPTDADPNPPPPPTSVALSSISLFFSRHSWSPSPSWSRA